MTKKTNKPLPKLPLEKKESLLFFQGFKAQAIIIFLVGFGFYANTLKNTFALDDGIVINTNDYVKQGFAGIPKILTTDAYDSFYTQMGSKQQLSGGRYRPLSPLTFAIEREIFGEQNWPVLHFFNVLFFSISVVVLLFLLRNYVFKSNPDLAFITTLLFTMHPIHTEVVANVKSRDEILSFLFVALTFIFAFKYQENKQNLQAGRQGKTHLVLGLACYFLALLSKEYAVLLIVLLPVAFYIFFNYDPGKSIGVSVPYMIVAGIYLFIRFRIVPPGHIENPEVLNNPYIYATKPQKWATKIATLSNYLKLLVFPHPLSSDYSYNTIPYKNFTNIWVWVSLAIHLTILYFTYKLFKKKHVLAFALLFYLLHLFMVSNLLMDIGATMGERLIYHSSLGFFMIVAWFLYAGFEKMKSSTGTKRTALLVLLVVVGALYGFKTVTRNAEWESDITLFLKDAETVPNSVLANGNAGARYIDLSEKPENKAQEMELVHKAISHLDKALRIHPKYVNGYLNLGIAYFKLKDFEKAEWSWNKAREIFPTNPMLRNFYPLLAEQYLNQAFNYGKANNYEAALKSLEKAVQIAPDNPKYLYNLGGAYFTLRQYNKARQVWERTLQVDPNNQEAKKGLTALQGVK